MPLYEGVFMVDLKREGVTVTELKREIPVMLRNKRLIVGLDDDHFAHLVRLAQKHEVSLSYLGHLAVLKMLLEDVRGEFTLVPQFQKGKPIHNA